MFSRYVTGWMVAYRESAELAKRLIEESCKKQDIQPGQLTLHADRGTSMRSKPVALLLADLGVTNTHSQPHVSDDNPFSESQFRTPESVDRSSRTALGASRTVVLSQSFFRWYNGEHRHSGIGLLTPATVHYGQRKTSYGNARKCSMLLTNFTELFVRSTPGPPLFPARSESTSRCPLRKRCLWENADEPQRSTFEKAKCT